MYKGQAKWKLRHKMSCLKNNKKKKNYRKLTLFSGEMILMTSLDFAENLLFLFLYNISYSFVFPFKNITLKKL